MPQTIVDREELRAALADILDIDIAQIADGTQFTAELGIDSLMALELLVELERRYGVRIAEDRLREITSLETAHALLVAELSGT